MEKKQQENSKKTTRKQQENRLMVLIGSNPTISALEMANQLGISYGSLRHLLEKMKGENLIRREGADKGGKWIVP